MVIVEMEEVKGYVSPPPYVRELKLFVSPFLQDEVKDISIGMTTLQPGCISSSHTHETETETWVVLEGKGQIVIDGKEYSVKKNTIAVVPPQTDHQLVNNSDEVFKVLWIYAPPGPEVTVLNQVHY